MIVRLQDLVRRQFNPDRRFTLTSPLLTVFFQSYGWVLTATFCDNSLMTWWTGAAGPIPESASLALGRALNGAADPVEYQFILTVISKPELRIAQQVKKWCSGFQKRFETRRCRNFAAKLSVKLSDALTTDVVFANY
jgi:hypothetical protein